MINVSNYLSPTLSFKPAKLNEIDPSISDNYIKLGNNPVIDTVDPVVSEKSIKLKYSPLSLAEAVAAYTGKKFLSKKEKKKLIKKGEVDFKGDLKGDLKTDLDENMDLTQGLDGLDDRENLDLKDLQDEDLHDSCSDSLEENHSLVNSQVSEDLGDDIKNPDLNLKSYSPDLEGMDKRGDKDSNEGDKDQDSEGEETGESDTNAAAALDSTAAALDSTAAVSGSDVGEHKNISQKQADNGLLLSDEDDDDFDEENLSESGDSANESEGESDSADGDNYAAGSDSGDGVSNRIRLKLEANIDLEEKKTNIEGSKTDIDVDGTTKTETVSTTAKLNINSRKEGQESKEASPFNSTPPTSPAEESDSDSKVIIDISQFQNINENDNDKGSRQKSKIFKNWKQLSKQSPPVGLLNHGVTCYMNSAIQSMIHIPAMQHYLNDINSGKHESTLKLRSVSHTLADLSKRMWESNKSNSKAKYINPKKIISRLDDINCVMSEWQQEDSHEYFMSLLSRLQEDSTPKGQKLNQSIIYDIFGGLLLQKITCNNCKNISKTNQEFYDLSLGFNKKRHNQIEAIIDSSNNTPPPVPGKYTIEKSIKDFFSSELIKLDNSDPQSGYTCESCHQKTQASKISYINESPETLTIHLKRFKFNGNSSSKVKQSISYSKYLDLTKYTINGDPTKYRLISVIVHEGRSLSSGHYISHCLQPDGSWCTYDDEYINKIPEHTALNDPAAYVLIYTKLTPKSIGQKRTNEDKSNSKVRKKKRV